MSSTVRIKAGLGPVRAVLHRRGHALSVASVVPLAAAMLAAASSKLGDVAAFQNSLEQWHVVGPAAAAAAAALVPVFELVAAACLALRSLRGPGLVLVGVMLFVFTSAFVLESIVHEAPRCACFGQWLEFENAKQRLWMFGLRNGALVALWALAVFFTFGARKVVADDPAGHHHR